MPSFQAKLDWNWSRKRENKNYHFDSFLPDALYHYRIISTQNSLEKTKKERKKKLSCRYVPS